MSFVPGTGSAGTECDPVTGLSWIASKMGTEILTAYSQGFLRYLSKPPLNNVNSKCFGNVQIIKKI
jgi:hypothetical protein